MLFSDVKECESSIFLAFLFGLNLVPNLSLYKAVLQFCRYHQDSVEIMQSVFEGGRDLTCSKHCLLHKSCENIRGAVRILSDRLRITNTNIFLKTDITDSWNQYLNLCL